MSAALADRVAAREWYHTLELAPGVVTPGGFDLRDMPDKVGLPASLGGQRCLDVGTFDGFWAFELERRGASEVLALDVPAADRTPGVGGADDHLGARVPRCVARHSGQRDQHAGLPRRPQAAHRLVPVLVRHG